MYNERSDLFAAAVDLNNQNVLVNTIYFHSLNFFINYGLIRFAT